MEFTTIPKLNPALSADIKEAIAGAFGGYAKVPNLKIPKPVIIRAGLRGGLPSDSLTTDLFWGCLPATSICYGNCFAAKAAFSRGYNFGCKIENILDADILKSDLRNIASSQKFVKNGFNSDPSHDWDKALEFAKIVTNENIHLLFVTKCLRVPSDAILEALANLKVELKISLSALDLDIPLNKRLSILKKYQSLGGFAVPNVITAAFDSEELNNRQNCLVDFLLENDIPACENPLRLVEGSKMAQFLRFDAIFSVPKNQSGENDSEVYCGALYKDKLPLPPYYSMKSTYDGLPSNLLSHLSTSFIDSCWDITIPTTQELSAGKIAKRSPRMSLILWDEIK